MAGSGCGRLQGAEAWQRYGYARLEDHCREVFGRSGRWLRDLDALGRALEGLPGLKSAVTGADGGAPLGRCRAVLIARVASAETAREWVALARRRSVVELKRWVREAREAGSAWPPDAASCTTLPSQPVTSSMSPAPEGEPDVEPRCRLALPVPLPVLAAFNEGLELYRAVEGSDASVTSFVEALSAEQMASGAPAPAVVDRSSIQGGESQAHQEKRMAVWSVMWSHLPRMGEVRSAVEGSSSVLARFKKAVDSMQCGPRMDAVHELAALLDLEDELEQRLGDLLLAMGEAGAWSSLGFSGVAHYAEERLGVSRSWAEDRVRAARALRRHPLLREPYASGRIGVEAVLHVARLLDAAPDPGEVMEAWVARASTCTVKRLRDEARELLRRRAGADDDRGAGGAAHADPPRPAAGGPLSDDAWFRSLLRRAGMARRRIERLAARARARRIADATLVLRLPESIADMFVESLAASCRIFSTDGSAAWPDGEAAPSKGGAAAAGGGSAPSEARAVPLWEGLLVMLEDFARTWDHDELDPVRTRAVDDALTGFGWRCAAPGCTSRRELQVHHIIYRSHGGSDARENLVPMCAFHHLRGQHGGRTWCKGAAPLDITWRLGAQNVGVWYRNERRVGVRPPES